MQSAIHYDLGNIPERNCQPEKCPYPLLDTLDNLVPYVRAHKVDDVIVALPWSSEEKIMNVMTKLRELPVNAYLSSDLIGFRLPFRQSPDHFGDMPLVEVMGQPLQGWGLLRKAILDYGLGAVLTVLLLPLMAIVALAIKLDSKGPVSSDKNATASSTRYLDLEVPNNAARARSRRHHPAGNAE